MSYYDFEGNRGFYQDNTREIIRQEAADIKQKYKRILIVFVIIAIFVNALAIYFIRQNMINNLTDDVRAQVSESLKAEITEEILLQYRREYYLPEGYSPIGVMVADIAMDSILEISCTASGKASRATAIILNSSGYIITNAHVITYERTGVLGGTVVYSNIKGNFANSTTEYSLQVVDYDTSIDLAILKFKSAPANLNPIVFMDSSLINLGEDCVAIGNAEGLGTSVTKGVVSNTPRNYEGTQVIQIDAAINPGNSGGPILNVYGELMAIATFKIVASEASEAMGFGITSNEARSYISKVNTKKGINITYTLSDK